MTYRIEVIREKDLALEERRNELIRWFKEEFGYIPLKWANPEWYILVLNGSELIGRLGLIERNVLIEGKQFHVGGVSGVITKKEWRGKGVGKALMNEAANSIKSSLNSSFGLLLCREAVSGFYQRLGWKVNVFSTTFNQPGAKLVFPKLTMVYSCEGNAWPRGDIDLNGLPW